MWQATSHQQKGHSADREEWQHMVLQKVQPGDLVQIIDATDELMRDCPTGDANGAIVEVVGRSLGLCSIVVKNTFI